MLGLLDVDVRNYMVGEKYDYVMYAPAVSGGSLTLLGLGLPDIVSILIIISLLMSMGFTVYRWVKLRQHYKNTEDEDGCSEEDSPH
mgnify:CR=1 FL=1